MHYQPILSFLTAIMAMIFTSCGDEDNPNPPVQEPFIEIAENLLTEGLNYTKEASTKQISVRSNTELSVSTDQPQWCTATLDKPNDAGYSVINVEVKANDSGSERKAAVEIKGGNISRIINVIQTTKSTDTPDEPVKPDTPEIPAGEAVLFAQSMGMGWNLGNQMDAFNNNVAEETAWGNGKATQAVFDKLASSGIQTVRIPVTWLGHIGDAPEYTIDAQWLNRVAELVGYAEKAGLKAIINIHHDGADGAHWLDIKGAANDKAINDRVKAQIAAMWTQIAEKFRDKGEFLIFESLNEIHDGGWGWGDNRKDGGKQYRTLNEWNQTFVDAVRATGGSNTTRYLGVPSYCTNPDLAITSFVLPKDPTPNRLMVSVHYYAPTEFSLEDKFSEWGHTGAPGKKANYGDEDAIKDTFSKLKNKFINKGIPVYIGETGCVHRSSARAESFRKYYLEYVCKAAREYGMPAIYWDNGSADAGKECSGLLDHATGEYLNNGEEIIRIMVKAATSTDPDYTLSTVYNSAP